MLVIVTIQCFLQHFDAAFVLRAQDVYGEAAYARDALSKG